MYDYDEITTRLAQMQQRLNQLHTHTSESPLHTAPLSDALEMLGGLLTQLHSQNTALFDAQQRLAGLSQERARLHTSESRYRTVTELATDYASVVCVEPDGQIVFEWITESFTRTTGYTLEDMQDPHILAGFVYADDIPLAQQRLARLLAGEPDISEFRIVTRSGAVRWLRACAEPIWDAEQGRVVCIYSAGQDITIRKQMEEALRLAQFSLDYSADGVYWNVPDGRIIYVNDAACRALGYTREELLNLRISDIDPAYPQDSWHTRWQEHRQHGALTFETYHQHKDGSTFPVEITSNHLTFNGHEYLCSFVRNISERKQMETALRASEERYHTLALQNARLYEAERQRVRELDALRTIMTEISGELDLDALLHTILEHAVALLDATSGMIGLYEEALQTVRVVVSHNMHKDYTGTQFALGEGVLGRVAASRTSLVIDNLATWEGRSPQCVPLGNGTVVSVPLLAGDQLIGAINVLDLDRQRRFCLADESLLTLFAQQATIAIRNARLFAEVRQLATTDSLTGLYNRRQFYFLAAHAFEQMLRYGYPLSVIMLDVDNFKRVNDTYGHAMGDQVLQTVGRLCLSVVRTVDIAGRYGGEEVVVLLPNTDLPGALQVAERLRANLAQTVVSTDQGALSITASMGAAVHHASDNFGLETLIDFADQALRIAKQTGKNRVIGWQDGLTVGESQPASRVRL